MKGGERMKTMKFVTVCLILAACIIGTAVKTAMTAEQRNDVLYYCDCGPQCKCDSVSTTPGNCKCDKPMKWGHVLKVEGDEALVCTCAEGCKCSLDPTDPTKCGCGNQMKRINLKGTGIYFCNCGGSCMCNTLSDKAGKCKCGMDLKKSE